MVYDRWWTFDEYFDRDGIGKVRFAKQKIETKKSSRGLDCGE